MNSELNHSLFEQMLYELILRIGKSDKPEEDKFNQTKQTGIALGKKILLNISKYTSFKTFRTFNNILSFIS